MRASLPVCLLVTREDSLAQKLEGFLRSIATVKKIEDEIGLDSALHHFGPALVVLDLRANKNDSMIELMARHSPQNVTIALGVPRSDSMLEVERQVFAVEDVQVDEARIQKLIEIGFAHLKLKVENTVLQRAKQDQVVFQQAFSQSVQERQSSRIPLRHFYRAFRHFDNVEALFESIIEGVASSTMLSRVGMFCWAGAQERYIFRSGLRCLEETQKISYSDRDPFVKWLQRHAHMISRSTFQHVYDESERIFLEQALKQMAAEIIIPLFARTRIIGWLFFGSRAIGIPFSSAELEDLLVVAEHISTSLDNALLHEELSVQKNLLENLFHSMPAGIVAVDVDAKVCWYNEAAGKIFGIPEVKVLNKPVESFNSRIADMLRRTILKKEGLEPRSWVDTVTKRAVSVQTRYLGGEKSGIGAVAVAEDVTAEKNLKEKQQQIERSKFWTELAANMSHQIRNPLVAIRTFAQLLPERYEDSEFRSDFWRIVPKEIDRLDKMIEQIDIFAHPPERVFTTLQPVEVLKKGIELARFRILPKQIHIEFNIPNGLPGIQGDESALTQCFAEVLLNAIEATAHKKDPKIILSVRQSEGRSQELVITVEDNGNGIAPEIREHVFSPFLTTKPIGMGLGLAVVHRSILDHNGRIEIETGEKGTIVTLTLPTVQAAYAHESNPHR